MVSKSSEGSSSSLTGGTISLSGHKYGVHAVAFSPDGKTLASGAGQLGGGSELKLWDVAAGTEQATLLGHRGAVLTVAFTPDGQTLATGGDDGTVRLWDVARRKGPALPGVQAGS